jgi:hypothetical protein
MKSADDWGIARQLSAAAAQLHAPQGDHNALFLRFSKIEMPYFSWRMPHIAK